MQLTANLDKVNNKALSPLNASDKAAVIKAVSQDDTGRNATKSKQSKQIQVLSKWSLAADVSKKLSQAEQTERSIRQAYQTLEGLRKQLMSSTSKLTDLQKQEAKQQIEKFEQEIAKNNSGLDSDLSLASSGPKPLTVSLNQHIDLLSPRKQSEQVNILFGRSGNAVSINLAGGQTAAQNLQTVQQAFGAQKIQVSTDNNQALYFSAQNKDARKLQEPWLISGQGVRVAAGNPISVKLQPAQSGLSKLTQAVTEENIESYKQQVLQAQKQLKEALAKVQTLRLELKQQLEQISQQAEEAELRALSQQLSLDMQSGARNSVSVVMSQANITRSLVEFGLG